MSINNLVVLGSGLIGGSVAKSAREAGVVNDVIVLNRQIETSDRAVALGIADIAKDYSQLAEVCGSLGQGDLVLVAADIQLCQYDQLADLLPAGVILRIALKVVNAAREHWQGDLSYFVPGHPIAGSEN